MDIDRVAAARPDELLRSLANGSISAVPSDATLDAVVEIFATDHVASVAVLDAERHVAGVIGTADLIVAYRRSLAESLGNLRSIFSGSILVEEEVRPGSSAAGRSVADAGWPNGTVVVAIQRGEQLIFPEPSTEVRKGDVLSALVSGTAEERLREVVGSWPASEEEEDEDQPMV